jgi:hypothetical protein
MSSGGRTSPPPGTLSTGGTSSQGGAPGEQVRSPPGEVPKRLIAATKAAARWDQGDTLTRPQHSSGWRRWWGWALGQGSEGGAEHPLFWSSGERKARVTGSANSRVTRPIRSAGCRQLDSAQAGTEGSPWGEGGVAPGVVLDVAAKSPWASTGEVQEVLRCSWAAR